QAPTSLQLSPAFRRRLKRLIAPSRTRNNSHPTTLRRNQGTSQPRTPMLSRGRTWWTWTSIQPETHGDPLAITPLSCPRIEPHGSGVYGPFIDLWPDDWAALLRTAGRTFRLPLQMIDNQACALSRARLS